MNKIKRGDTVIAIAGRDKGKKGVVESVMGDKMLVKGLNIVKKHVKGNPNTGETGGIVDKSLPIHRSNLAAFDPQNQKASRVGIRVLEDGRRVRYLKTSKEVIDVNNE